MRRRSAAGAALVLLAVGGLTACTADAVDRASSASQSSAAPGTTAARDDAGDIPVIQGSGHDWAGAEFGADEVAAAVTAVERIARIALADCRRWTTGEVDPELAALVTPELLTRALEELDRSKEYGGMSPPALLSHLPEDDGNGHDLVAASRDGCEASGPLRMISGPLGITVKRSGEPGLLLSGGFAMNVQFGSTVVSAGQDWVFTMEQTSDGWLLADVGRVTTQVNWAPPFPA